MEENIIIKSEKISYKKQFKLARVIVICLLVIVFGVSIFQHINYLQGQSCAVELMKASSDRYDNFSGSYTELVQEMYDDLNPYGYSYSYNGYVFDNSETVSTAYDVDKALGELLESKGYDCFISGSDYLKYTGILGYFESTIDNCSNGGLLCLGFIISIGLGIALIILNLFYNNISKKEIFITEDSIICKNKSKIVKEFLIKDISTIELSGFKGLKIIGNSINYSIKLVENRAEIKDFIMSKIATFSKQIPNNALQNSADELKKYKDLLDSGVITQEEFESKKKQLLGL